jgi:hypothetical protein
MKVHQHVGHVTKAVCHTVKVVGRAVKNTAAVAVDSNNSWIRASGQETHILG